MKRKDLTGIFLFFTLLFFSHFTFAAPVPDTGQTKCYDDDANGNAIPCPSPGHPFYGQDANYTINPPSYTKLDANGNALPDSASSWTMVLDNVTGLIWEMKTNKDGVIDYFDPHDADNTYTWYDSNPATNGGYAGTPRNGTDTEDFIKSLNDAHYGGHSDWRLPTVYELSSIVNFNISSFGQSINTDYFPNTQASSGSTYWSSDAGADDPDLAGSVDFYIGTVCHCYKAINFYVRAVRGGHIEATVYSDNGNGTVTDTSTGLMWQQGTSENTMTWEQALSYCEHLNLGNYTDWRLPTIKELRSLADYTIYNPSINSTYFPNTLVYFPNTQMFCFYWSSTTLTFYIDYAWTVSFGSTAFGAPKGCSGYVRAVRGGLSVAPSPPAPDIKANGQDGPLTVSSGSPVSITASLVPGDQNGKLADWWLVESTPWGIYSLNSSGWSSGINMLFQYPLVSVSPVEIYKGSLPAGDYAFLFGVDMSPNAVVDSPLYYDFVQVHVTEAPTPTPTPTPTPDCAYIGGTWHYSTIANVHGVIDGESLDQPVKGSGNMNINQQGCNISWSINGTTIEGFAVQVLRSGTVNGNTVQVSGTFLQYVGNEGYPVFMENLFTATGTVSGNTLPMTGSGRATGTFYDIYGGTHQFVFTGDDSTILTRASSSLSIDSLQDNLLHNQNSFFMILNNHIAPFK